MADDSVQLGGAGEEAALADADGGQAGGARVDSVRKKGSDESAISMRSHVE
jgi:hypothetical protein